MRPASGSVGELGEVICRRVQSTLRLLEVRTRRITVTTDRGPEGDEGVPVEGKGLVPLPPGGGIINLSVGPGQPQVRILGDLALAGCVSERCRTTAASRWSHR
jgi:hypothetical protein